MIEIVINRLANNISKLTRYSDLLVQYQPLEHDSLDLFERVSADKKLIVNNTEELVKSSISEEKRAVILLNGNLNHSLDIQNLLNDIKSGISRFSRLVIVLYNPYFGWIHTLLSKLGIKKDPLPVTFITRTDLKNILDLCGYKITYTKCVGIFPYNLFGLGRIINQVLENIPIIKWLSNVYLIIIRPVVVDKDKRPVSIVIPARNEYGNIRKIINELEAINSELEVIFVEGNSTDNTWEEIQKVAEEYKDKFVIKTIQQNGVGKGDAVRLGFSNADNELFTILDADLSVSPELVNYFIDAFHQGHADFINGTRLMYPMEGKAMRYLNWLGNIFFAKSLSWVLEVPLGDSLCGTKLFHRDDYSRMMRWWADFGETDPFGDFELLFPASVIALGITDIPVHYRARTYGDTNIKRFHHGLMLFKIVIIGFLRLKLDLFNGQKH